MRLRAAFVVSLIILSLSIGCRNALSPHVDRNRAPETWITAAPLDTITIRERGLPPQTPTIGTVPYRFHMYWAGADYDGAVVGFYWAVVETLPKPDPTTGTTALPPLPGPRPSDYHWTTRTDSTFTFNVSEYRPDRQHAFFIYAVDDKGRADATPARFVFNALDRFPPKPVLDVSQALGWSYFVPQHGRIDSVQAIAPGKPPGPKLISDVEDPHRPLPSDTVLSNARIDFAWHDSLRTPGGFAVKYKYKLDEIDYVTVDSSVHSVSYNTHVGGDIVASGRKVFNLLAIDAAGGADNINRRFWINRMPDSWFAGPDSNLVPRASSATDRDDLNQRVLTITDWSSQTPQGSGSMLSCDSLYYWPSERRQRRTFWEIYKNKLYLRAEGDTVHMNSIVCVQPGGADFDSPFAVRVVRENHPPNIGTCTAEPSRSLNPGPANGSPTGFRLQYANGIDPNNYSIAVPSQTAQFPVFDATQPGELSTVNGYIPFFQSGQVYLIVRARDGDDQPDDRLPDMNQARNMAANVDAGDDSDPYHRLLRNQVLMMFYVNRAPYLDFNNPQFFPLPPLHPGDPVAASPDRKLRLFLPSVDPDPYDPADRPLPGGPSSSTVLRLQATVTGKNADGRDTTYTTPRFFTATFTIDLAVDAPYIVNNNLTVTVQVCDCATCEDQPGTGRCVMYPPIPVTVTSTAFQMGNRPTGVNLEAHQGRSLKP